VCVCVCLCGMAACVPPAPPSGCTPDPASIYFRDLSEIHGEMRSIAAGLDGVEVYAPGPPTLLGQEVLAIQFGPLMPQASPAPALLVTGTLHAREWAGTAVTQAWIRHLATTVADPTTGPQLAEALQRSAVVVVPVANPDGYNFTRTTDRNHRGNMNLTAPPGATAPICAQGVDLNRNFPVAFEETTAACGRSTHPGVAPSSEIETQNLEALMAGAPMAPQHRAFDVVTVVDYHSNLGSAAITNGYKAASDANGPRCAAGNPGFCANPEYPLYSTVFGHAASPAWDDPISGGHLAFEHSWAVQSYVGGTFRLYTSYRNDGPRALGLLVELPEARWEFNAECRSDAEITGLAEQQILALSHAVGFLGELGLARSDMETFTPMGQAVREWSSEPATFEAEDSARMMWLSSTSKTAVPPLLLHIDGLPDVPLEPWRSGAFYDLYAYRPEAHGRDPLDWPCCFQIGQAQGGAVTGVCSTLCPGGHVDLCDPGRVPGSGWELMEATRRGKRDCFLTPNAPDGELLMPAGKLDVGRTWRGCTVHFTLDADSAIPEQGLSFEREVLSIEGTSTSTFEPVQRVSFPRATSILTPIGVSPADGMLSFSYPVALSPLPLGGGFRIVSTALPPELFHGGLRISDFVITCAFE